MRKRSALLASGILAAAMLAGTAAPNAAATQEPTAPAPTWDTRLTIADRRSSDVALAVEQRAAFSGIRVTPDHTAIEVYVTHRDSALEAAARAAAGPAQVRFTRVRHSHKALRALQRRILNDHMTGKLGATLTAVPVVDSLNKVAVEIEDFGPKKQAALLARYGRDNVVVRQGGKIKPAAASRVDDSAPWNSGSFITSPQGEGGCTAGPGVKDSTGKEYLLSAGHCFIDYLVGGTSGWDFAVYQDSPASGDDPVRIGTAKARYPEMHEDDMDLALITLWSGGSGRSFRTTSPTAVATSPFQKGAIRAVENTWVCTSGAYTGEKCGLQVDGFDDPYPTGQGGLARIIHVNSAHHVFSEAVAGGGDSGGPVYQSASDGVYVAGIIHGPMMYWAPENLTCPNNSFYNRGNDCGSRVLFTGINSAMAHFGVTLNVG